MQRGKKTLIGLARLLPVQTCKGEGGSVICRDVPTALLIVPPRDLPYGSGDEDDVCVSATYVVEGYQVT